MTGKPHVFPTLTNDLVAGGDGCTFGPKPPDGQVITIVDKILDGCIQVHQFVDHAAIFLLKEGSVPVRIQLDEQWSYSLVNHIHVRSPLIAG